VPYQSLIGSLLYASVITRPDITMVVSHLSRYVSDPSQSHWEQAKRVLRYLKGTTDSVLMYGGAPSSKVVGWSNYDHASDIGERRSRTGYVFMLNGAAVNWKSQRQQTVALSIAEAEYHIGGENSRALPRRYKFEPLDYACHNGKTQRHALPVYAAPTHRGRPPSAIARAQLTQPSHFRFPQLAYVAGLGPLKSKK
jgi:hypothetical protein